MVEKNKYKTRLNKPSDVRKLLARLVNEVRDGSVNEASARCQGQLCSVILKCFEVSETAERLNALEKANKQRIQEEEGCEQIEP